VLDGAVGTGRDDHEVAVPRCELLERREQLLPFGSPLCPANPLLGLPGGEIATFEELLLPVLRGRAALGCSRQDRLGRVGRLELRVEVGAACRLDQRSTPLFGRRVEQTGCASAVVWLSVRPGA